MKINEICKKANMTKKAVEYYQSKGLVTPNILANGYREFSEVDLSILKEIALFRKLGLSVIEINQILLSNNRVSELIRIKKNKQMKLEEQSYQMSILENLINGESYPELQMRLDDHEINLSIIEKLKYAFPGFFGKYMSIHYGRFLTCKVKTHTQKQLINKLMVYLDNIEAMEISIECQNLMDELDQSMSDEELKKMTQSMVDVYKDIGSYWENNKQQILVYKNSKKSVLSSDAAMGEFENIAGQIKKTVGYSEIFIPTMRALSPDFEAYYKMLLKANNQLELIAPELYETNQRSETQ